MLVLISLVSLLILCISHYSAFQRGKRVGSNELYYRYLLPLARRHERVVRRFEEASLDDAATAQQKNLKLVAQNAVLRGKAIHYLQRYRRATRRGSLEWDLRRRLAFLGIAIAQLEPLRKRRRSIS